MSNQTDTDQAVHARITDMLPITGLAYATDEAGRLWTLTRSMPGDGFEELQPGRAVLLELAHDLGHAWVRRWRNAHAHA